MTLWFWSLFRKTREGCQRCWPELRRTACWESTWSSMKHRWRHIWLQNCSRGETSHMLWVTVNFEFSLWSLRLCSTIHSRRSYNHPKIMQRKQYLGGTNTKKVEGWMEHLERNVSNQEGSQKLRMQVFTIFQMHQKPDMGKQVICDYSLRIIKSTAVYW